MSEKHTVQTIPMCFVHGFGIGYWALGIMHSQMKHRLPTRTMQKAFHVVQNEDPAVAMVVLLWGLEMRTLQQHNTTHTHTHKHNNQLTLPTVAMDREIERANDSEHCTRTRALCSMQEVRRVSARGRESTIYRRKQCHSGQIKLTLANICVGWKCKGGGGREGEREREREREREGEKGGGKERKKTRKGRENKR